MLYKFPACFRVAYRINTCDCHDIIEMYEIEAEVFSESEEKAKELLLSWLPGPYRIRMNGIRFLKEETGETRTGVLFLSRKDVYRGDSGKAPD